MSTTATAVAPATAAAAAAAAAAATAFLARHGKPNQEKPDEEKPDEEKPDEEEVCTRCWNVMNYEEVWMVYERCNHLVHERCALHGNCPVCGMKSTQEAVPMGKNLWCYK